MYQFESSELETTKENTYTVEFQLHFSYYIAIIYQKCKRQKKGKERNKKGKARKEKERKGRNEKP